MSVEEVRVVSSSVRDISVMGRLLDRVSLTKGGNWLGCRLGRRALGPSRCVLPQCLANAKGLLRLSGLPGCVSIAA